MMSAFLVIPGDNVMDAEPYMATDCMSAAAAYAKDNGTIGTHWVTTWTTVSNNFVKTQWVRVRVDTDGMVHWPHGG